MSQRNSGKNLRFGSPLFGLAAAGSFSISAVLIRGGLATGASSLAGLWIGFSTALAIYVPMYMVTRRRLPSPAQPTRAVLVQVLAGIAITFGMWFRYIAMNTVPVGVVTALGRLNIPLILLVSPVFLKSRLDATSPRLWVGSLLIIAGATVIVFAG